MGNPRYYSFTPCCTCGESSILLIHTLLYYWGIIDTTHSHPSVLLDMASQVSNVCRSAYYHLFRIAKIRASLTIVACKTLVHTLVTYRLDYGNALLWHHWPSVAPPWDDPTLGGQDHYVHQGTRSAKHNGGASTTALATREVAYQLQEVVLVFRALHGLTPVMLWW